VLQREPCIRASVDGEAVFRQNDGGVVGSRQPVDGHEPDLLRHW